MISESLLKQKDQSIQLKQVGLFNQSYLIHDEYILYPFDSKDDENPEQIMNQDDVVLEERKVRNNQNISRYQGPIAIENTNQFAYMMKENQFSCYCVVN